MTTKEIKAIMAAIDGCQFVISALVEDEMKLTSECADKELHDTYFCLNRCWLHLNSMLKEVQE